MEITHHQVGDWTELRVRGRLDGYWSDHFSQAFEEQVRQGAHHVRLDLSEVVFLSSAGVRVLLRGYKQLAAIQGRLTVSNPSEPVKKVLELSGLTALLVAAEVVPATPDQPAPAGVKVERGNVAFQVFELDSTARLRCQTIGDPSLLNGCRFRAEDCRKLSFPSASLGIGLGALGNDFADSQNRFGEFLAVAGAVTYLPTDGTGVPDYLVARESAVPDLQVCYGVTCEGPFARMARFESKADEPITLSELVAGCLELAGSEPVGLVIVAEAAGLIGAALRRSPAAGPTSDAPFGFPLVRDWLSFTTERAFPRSLALVVGVAGRNPPAALAPFVRPLDGAGLHGHLHAAAFSYQPLPRGVIDLKTTVASLFETQTLQGVFHLLNDARAVTGGGESTFLRGVCWIGRISDVA